MDAIICNFKVWYFDPVAICESLHARPKRMKDDDDYLKPFETKKAKDAEHKKISRTNHEEGCGLHSAYVGTVGRHGYHICAIPRPVSLIPII